jgi:ribosomal protein L11 methyltransferase
MKYKKIDIYTNRDALDLLSQRLYEVGVVGAVIHDGVEVEEFLQTKSSAWDYADEEVVKLKDEPPFVTVYVSSEDYDLIAAAETLVTALQSESDVFGQVRAEYETVDDASWENEWKKYYKPFVIGNLTIVPAWETSKEVPGSNVIEIDPSGSFGTGRHETTSMCIAQLQKEVQGGENVLDLGSGSGILSVAALKCGAKSVYAVDVSSVCTSKTTENLLRNGYTEKDFAVEEGDIIENTALVQRIGIGYDIVTANIIADVIIAMSSLMHTFLKKGGVLIASGIIEERADEVTAALADAGFGSIVPEHNNGWVMLRCEK